MLIASDQSKTHELTRGVPLGSVKILEPLLFTVLYDSSSIYLHIMTCVAYHLYAYDTPNTHARSLGVTFDSNVSLKRHVVNKHFQNGALPSPQQWTHSSLFTTTTYHMGARQLELALVISRINCCNSFLDGLSVAVIEIIKHVINAYARITLFRSKRDHVTPMLLELHWLPIKSRITFKIPLLTFKCLHGRTHPYLLALLSPYFLTHSLRSSGQLLLKQPISSTKIGERSFSYATPRAWNQLLLTVRQCSSVLQFKVALNII